jgi:plasmid stability protein
MATNLVVRNVEEDVALALKQRAALHGRSAEAEHREILKQALHRPKRRSFADVLLSMPDVGTDADFAPDRP